MTSTTYESFRSEEGWSRIAVLSSRGAKSWNKENMRCLAIQRRNTGKFARVRKSSWKKEQSFSLNTHIISASLASFRALSLSSVPRRRRRNRFVMFAFFCKLISHREKIRRHEDKMFRQNSNRKRPTQFHSSLDAFQFLLQNENIKKNKSETFFFKFISR